MSFHIRILIISMFVKLISSISRSTTFIKLLYKTNVYILIIWLFYTTSVVYKSD
jgi:hypothetical protein